MHTVPKTALRTLLLILLLAVQGLCHAHQVEHVLDGDGGFCSICSVSGGDETAVVETGETTIAGPLPQIAPINAGRVQESGAEYLPDARAPPLS